MLKTNGHIMKVSAILRQYQKLGNLYIEINRKAEAIPYYEHAATVKRELYALTQLEKDKEAYEYLDGKIKKLREP